jgi:hypothetical protein
VGAPVAAFVIGWMLVVIAPRTAGAALASGVTRADLAVASVAPADDGFVVTVPENQQGADLDDDGDQVDAVVEVVQPGAPPLNTHRAASSWVVPLHGGAVAIARSEAGEQADLTGDGDQADVAFEVWDPIAGVTLVPYSVLTQPTALTGGGVAFWVSESGAGQDLNGDGDTGDSVLHTWSAAAGVVDFAYAAGYFAMAKAMPGNGVWFTVGESAQGDGPLNGDGDVGDDVGFVALDPSVATAANTGLAWSFGPSGEAVGAVLVSVRESLQGADLNGDGDQLDVVPVGWAGGSTLSLGVAVSNAASIAADGTVIFGVIESAQGNQDRNGDGDTTDMVVATWNRSHPTVVVNTGVAATHWIALRNGTVGMLVSWPPRPAVWDPATGSVQTLPLVSQFFQPSAFGDSGIAVRVSESSNSTDYNGDGDLLDQADVAWDPVGGTTASTGAAGSGPMPMALSDGELVVSVSESSDGRDHNGDGDQSDTTAAVWALGEPARDLGLALSVGPNEFTSGDWAAFIVSEAAQSGDMNGDGDESDNALVLYTPTEEPPPPADATPPVVSSVVLHPQYVHRWQAFTVTATVDDATTGDSLITGATIVYGVSRVAMTAVDGAFDEATEDVTGSLDASGFVGTFSVCVTGRDAGGNDATSGCATQTVAEAPVISGVSISPPVVFAGEVMTVTATATDFPDGPAIGLAYVLIDGNTQMMVAVDGALDERTEDLTASFAAPGSPGSYRMCVSAHDVGLYVGTACSSVTVYERPSSVAAAGSLAGVEGRLTFAVSAKYDKAGTPAGSAWFQVGGHTYRVEPLDVLARSGATAWLAGAATLDGATGFRADIRAIDEKGADAIAVTVTDVTGDPVLTVPSTVLKSGSVAVKP